MKGLLPVGLERTVIQLWTSLSDSGDTPATGAAGARAVLVADAPVATDDAAGRIEE